jgi:hypothetical protein
MTDKAIDNTKIDAAIGAGNRAVKLAAFGSVCDARTYFRAGVAKLLEGLDDYRDPLAEMRRRAGIGGSHD